MDRGIRRLWVFDFDGTLSPLVPDRNAARLDPECQALLADLASDPRDRVAVLSSRLLDDLVTRVPLRSVWLGGGSGLEWLLPGGDRIVPAEETGRMLERIRVSVLPLLERVAAIPGVEVEEKFYSVAVHFRRVRPEGRPTLFPLLAELTASAPIRCFLGPEVADLQFFPWVNKAYGIRRLSRILDFDPLGARIVYAGDDENDAVAMRSVLSRGGRCSPWGAG